MVLDTHVWLWWLSEPTLLSKKARTAIEETLAAKRRLKLSTISTWEIALLVQKGRLSLSLPTSAWVDRSEALGMFDFIPVNNSIALRSVELEMHADPADRIITATSLELASTLITKDEKLRRLPIPTLW